MIVHLHQYNEDHIGCAYCAFQKLKRARNTALEEGYLVTITGRLNWIINEICTNLDTMQSNNVLLTNIATNNLKPLGTIMEKIGLNKAGVVVVESLLIKNDEVSFGQHNSIMTLEEKRAVVEVDEQKREAVNFNGFDHFVFIDDVHDTGDSFQIAKEKLAEFGVMEEDISLITILEIGNND